MSSWKHDAVADVPRATHAGNVALPIEYADTTYFMAVFRAAFAEAQERVAPFGLDAVRLHGEEAVAVLMFASYGRSTIGPYLECGLAIAAVPSGTDPMIRSLLSLTFLSLVYAYFFDNKPWMRWALLAASVPIAIIANAGRVTITGIITTTAITIIIGAIMPRLRESRHRPG